MNDKEASNRTVKTMELGEGMRVTFNTLASTRLRHSSDLRVPSAWTLDVNRSELPYLVRLEVVARTGIPVCKSMICEQRAGGSSVATALLRRIPVDRLVTESIVNLGLVTRVEPGQSGTFIIRPAHVDEVAHGLRRARRIRLTPEHLREVAGVYNSGGSAPTEAVHARWGAVDRRTVDRWVRAARRDGLIPPWTGKRSIQLQGDKE